MTICVFYVVFFTQMAACGSHSEQQEAVSRAASAGQNAQKKQNVTWAQRDTARCVIVLKGRECGFL